MSVFPLRNRSIAGDQYNWAISASYKDGMRVFDPSQALANDPDIYTKMRIDPVVGQAIDQRCHMVAAPTWRCEPASDDKNDIIVAEIMEQLLRKIPRFTESRRKLAEAVAIGGRYAAMTGDFKQSRVYDETPRNWWIPGRIIDTDRRRWRAVASVSDAGRISIVWQLWHVGRGAWEDIERPEFYIKHIIGDTEDTLGHGRGLIESLHNYLYAKTVALRDGLQGLKRWAKGVVIAKVEGGRDAKTGNPNLTLLQSWVNELKKMQSDGAIAHDINDDIAVLDGPSTGYQMVKDFIAYLDNSMRVRILGANLPTSAEKGGSFALAAVQENSTAALIQGDQELLDDTLTNDLIRMVWNLNRPIFAEMGYGDARMPRFQTVTERPKDPKERAEIISTLLQAGVPLKADELYEDAGFTMPGPEDKVVMFDAGQFQPVGDRGGRLPFPIPKAPDEAGEKDAAQDAGTDDQDAARTQDTRDEVQDTGLNGAQVSSITEIVKDVTTGALPPESAKAMIRASFPTLGDQVINDMIDPAAAHTPPEVSDDGEGT